MNTDFLTRSLLVYVCDDRRPRWEWDDSDKWASGQRWRDCVTGLEVSLRDEFFPDVTVWHDANKAYPEQQIRIENGGNEAVIRWPASGCAEPLGCAAKFIEALQLAARIARSYNEQEAADV